MMDVTYKMDKRWSGYVRPYTKEIFDQLAIDQTTTKSELPTEINRHLLRVRSILRVISIDYELLDVAEFYLYGVLELALRDVVAKHRELNPKWSLRNLLEIAKKDGLIKIEQKGIEFISSTRNDFAHINSPESLHGITSSYVIPQIVDIIDELYKEKA